MTSGIATPWICAKILLTCYACLLLLLLPCTVQASSNGSGSGDEGEGDTGNSFELNFIFLSSDNERLMTSGSIPAVDIALEMVADYGILGKYTLGYSAALDSQVGMSKN